MDEVMRTLPTKKLFYSDGNEQTMTGNYLLKSSTNIKGHNLVGSSLEVVTEKFIMLPPWIVIISCLDQSDLYVIKMKTMNGIMALKNHSNSNLLCKQIPGAIKRQSVCFKISIDLLYKCCKACKRTYVEGDVENMDNV